MELKRACVCLTKGLSIYGTNQRSTVFEEGGVQFLTNLTVLIRDVLCPV